MNTQNATDATTLNLIANTIRTLTLDAVEKAQSGHPGLPMGCADIASILFCEYLRFNPANPAWRNRDRFVLSAGHGSMLIYSLLHLTGVEAVTLEQIKNFRQWHSITPGHPEFHETPGVECTTGPLGQGTGNSVGMAIAQKHIAATFNTPEFPICDHHIYAIVSDGDLQEGISHEAAALAGHLGLDNLIWIYDDNQVSIEGRTDLAYSDDVPLRFRGYHWHVIEIDGHNHDQIRSALSEARATKGQPTIIIAKTKIGFGSPKLQGQHKAHSDPFGPEEVAATKRNLGWPHDAQFLVPDQVKAHFAALRPHWAAQEAAWNELLTKYAATHPEKAALYEAFWQKQIPTDISSRLPQWPADSKPQATRNSAGEAQKFLMAEIKNIIGGSADLAPSTKTWHKEYGSLQKNSYAGRTLHFGIREHGMGAIVAGIGYYGGLIPFGATFFVFTDYMRPPIRLMALSKIQGIFIMTHDSVFVGEDGPTHEPVETLATVRAIPNCSVIRPSDANESALAWLMAIEKKDGPTIIVLTRQNIPVIDRTKCAPVEHMRRGAYTLWESQPSKTPEILLLATGSEVHITLQAAERLDSDGRAVRVVAMPSWDIFEKQPQSYKDQVLPPSVEKRLAVEAGVSLGWHRYIGPAGKMIAIDHFGASAPYQRIAKEFGITADNVYAKARELLG